jgi:Skp family chaperone for outer membrane proteins
MIESDRNMQQQGAESLMAGITSAVGSIANAYADRKSTEAKADSYAKIGEILGSTMFQNNPQAAQALADLKKEKDPYARTMGYEALLSFAGPYSNFMNAQGRMEQAPALQDQRTNDQRDIMYERERLQREREAMNTPQGPAPVAVPTAMRRFNKPI